MANFRFVDLSSLSGAKLIGVRHSGPSRSLLSPRVPDSPWVAWPLALFVLGVAIQLSVSRFRTRERLLFTAGALACAWLVLALYVAPGPAIGLAYLAGGLYRQSSEMA